MQQRKIESMNDSLNELNQTKDRFFSIIAHDLRSPIMGITSIGKMLLDKYGKLEEQEREEIINLLYGSAQRTSALLENLLQWAEAESGRMEFNSREIRVKPFIADVVQLLQSTAEQKKIQVKIDIEDTSSIFADSRMLNSVFRNLLSNAIKFTPANGRVTIGVKEDSKENLLIYVKDTGVGIDTQSIEHLFSLAQKKSTNGTEGENGSGLGLILCKQFINKNNGTIWVESNVSKGSTFWISLPSSGA
jgi:signal transduction histidine kinase